MDFVEIETVTHPSESQNLAAQLSNLQIFSPPWKVHDLVADIMNAVGRTTHAQFHLCTYAIPHIIKFHIFRTHIAYPDNKLLAEMYAHFSNPVFS